MHSIQRVSGLQCAKAKDRWEGHARTRRRLRHAPDGERQSCKRVRPFVRVCLARARCDAGAILNLIFNPLNTF